MEESKAVRVDPFFVDELLSKEEREIRDRVRAFSEREVIPIMVDCWERAEFPFGLVPKVAGLGICGDTIKGYGCAGLSAVASGLVAMELARGDGSVYTFFGAHSGFAMNSIAALGSEEQKGEVRVGGVDEVVALALDDDARDLEHGASPALHPLVAYLLQLRRSRERAPAVWQLGALQALYTRASSKRAEMSE